jgi:glyoxylase-like metal-dependent hydrolase (beta-lactamase superfamily II)
VIVDPGLDAIDFVQQQIDEYGLRPIAILATHGHVDHIWQVYPLATDLDIPAVIHKFDREFLTNPAKAISSEGAQLISSLAPEQIWLEPKEIVEVKDRTVLEFAGFQIRVLPTPGHTAGSVCFQFGEDRLFTGDLLFKNAIGRTDLFSGDPSQMQHSLRLIMDECNDDMQIYPGHGPNSTIGAERKSNPFLLKLQEQ